MKRYLSTLIAVFFFWIIAQVFLFKYVIGAIDTNNKLYLGLFVDLFYICLYLFIGLLIGWFCKTKGGLLGFIFGIFIITLIIINVYTSDLFKNEVIKMDGFHAMIKFVFCRSNVIIITCSALGGYLGSKLRLMNKKKDDETRDSCASSLIR